MHEALTKRRHRFTHHGGHHADPLATPWRWRDEAVGIVTLGLTGLIAVAVLPHTAPETPLVHLDQGRLHAGVGFAICAWVLFALGATRRALVSLGFASALLASVALFSTHGLAAVEPERRPDLRLVSFNILAFNQRGEDIAQFLEADAPDIAFILEAPAIHDELEALATTFPYSAGCDPGLRCDLALLSKLPLLDVEILPFYSVPGRLIRARVEVDGQPVTLIAAHLTKPYYGNAHDRQLARLVDVLDELDGPVILAGDFNSQAFVAAFHDALIDRAGLRVASHMRPTWPALASPLLSQAGFAIDHILIGGPISLVHADVLDDPLGSNHRGLTASFDLDGQ